MPGLASSESTQIQLKYPFAVGDFEVVVEPTGVENKKRPKRTHFYRLSHRKNNRFRLN